VASAALRGEPTGAPTGFRSDVVATAKRALKAGEILDGEGGVVAKHVRLGDLRIMWHLMKMYVGDALYCLSNRDLRGMRMSRSLPGTFSSG